MKVLLAIDGSAPSHIAVAQVAERLWPNGTIIEVLTVVHPAVPLAVDPAFALAAAHVEELHEQQRNAKAVVEKAVNQIRALAPDVELTTKTLEGHPKDVIVQDARDWGADLIVVGSHGYGRVRRMVLGSVAEAVVANAPCSVHVAREKHHTEHIAA